MIEAHPDETDLVEVAFSSLGQDEVRRHITECAECRDVVDALRTQANALRLIAVEASEATPDCLDDESIAAFAEGTIDPADLTAAVTHLSACARCSQEVASVARLLCASSVTSELARLGERSGSGKRRRHLLRGFLMAGALAAGLLILLVPGSTQRAKRLYREESVTGAAAPRLVAPIDAAAPLDTFRWTSVPRADRYRITVFSREGSVIWEAQTRDTAISLPDVVARVPDGTVLWRVEAHAGWEDRWASSDLATLTFHRTPR